MEHRGGRRTKSGRRTRRKEEGGPVLSLSLSAAMEHRGGRRARRGRRTRRKEEGGRKEHRAHTPMPHISHTSHSPQALGLAIPAGPVARALSPRLSPEQPATLDLHPPAVGPFLLACPPSNQQRWSCSHEGMPFLLSLTHRQKARRCLHWADSQTHRPCLKRPPWMTFSFATSSSSVSAIHVYN
ncbi:hypothetical protein ACFX13_043604 [Malus domestica]